MKTVVIFGGTGFIGLHLSATLLEKNLAEKIVLVDIKRPEIHTAFPRIKEDFDNGVVSYIEADVRHAISTQVLLHQTPELVVNLAAVHREPGHKKFEYFETNILGAENVSEYAKRVNCKNIIFTSSISPYGPSESELDERSLTCPETAYGSSKLAAEYIHKLWQKSDPEHKLLIVRPGVVFGPGEGGNVSRLVRSIVRRGFFFGVNASQVRKAGIYVKELCEAIIWLNNKLNQRSAGGVILSNLTFDPGPTMVEYVTAIDAVVGPKSRLIPVPPVLLMTASHLISFFLRGTNIARQLDPMRVRKICRSNNIRAWQLTTLGYQYKYTLDSAFADWAKDTRSEWI